MKGQKSARLRMRFLAIFVCVFVGMFVSMRGAFAAQLPSEPRQADGIWRSALSELVTSGVAEDFGQQLQELLATDSVQKLVSQSPALDGLLKAAAAPAGSPERQEIPQLLLALEPTEAEPDAIEQIQAFVSSHAFRAVSGALIEISADPAFRSALANGQLSQEEEEALFGPLQYIDRTIIRALLAVGVIVGTALVVVACVTFACVLGAAILGATSLSWIIFDQLNDDPDTNVWPKAVPYYCYYFWPDVPAIGIYECDPPI